jgi:hypothetical protein
MASIKATKINPSQKKTRTIKIKTTTRLTLRRPMTIKMIKTKKMTNKATAIRMTPAKMMMVKKTNRARVTRMRMTKTKTREIVTRIMMSRAMKIKKTATSKTKETKNWTSITKWLVASKKYGRTCTTMLKPETSQGPSTKPISLLTTLKRF